MVYSSELYYLLNPDFPLRHAVTITAQITGQWCDHYQAVLLAPKPGIKEKKREESLPEDPHEKKRLITELVDWIINSSNPHDIFLLQMTNTSSTKDMNIFNHPDDTCCWTIEISEEKFTILQSEWEKHGLPRDLFYPAGTGHIVNNHHYTPKEWEAKQSI